MNNNKCKLLDVVALLTDIPEKKLVAGQVGTIVEELNANVYEVEFSNNKGETLDLAAIESKNLLLLHYELETA